VDAYLPALISIAKNALRPGERLDKRNQDQLALVNKFVRTYDR
jgi:hypothetical protein